MNTKISHTAVSHTEYPWEAIESEPDERICVRGANGFIVAEVVREQHDGREQERANAALIAAAPELEIALEVALSALQGNPCRQQAIDDARRVLMKVREKKITRRPG